jgi:hypothetical protein
MALLPYCSLCDLDIGGILTGEYLNYSMTPDRSQEICVRHFGANIVKCKRKSSLSKALLLFLSLSLFFPSFSLSLSIFLSLSLFFSFSQCGGHISSTLTNHFSLSLFLSLSLSISLSFSLSVNTMDSRLWRLSNQ